VTILLKKELIFNNSENISTSTAIIIGEIRLPRIILAFIVGAGLAVAGAVFQAIIRNPMVDPYIIGISAGAGTGVMLALFLGIEIVVFNLNSLILKSSAAFSKNESILKSSIPYNNL